MCRHLTWNAARHSGGRFSELAVQTLDLADSRDLVEALAAGRGISRQHRAVILLQCQGNPFYIEEMVRSLTRRSGNRTEAGKAEQSDRLGLIVSQGIHRVIIDRVDRLSAELKTILQLAAVAGRAFAWAIVERAKAELEDSGGNMRELLWELEEQGFLVEERSFPEQEYSFNHAITQQALYRSLEPTVRKVLHGRMACAMEKIYAANLDEHLEELAFHYERSGNIEKAVDYLFRAGRRAWRNCANGDAIRHLRSCLRLLSRPTGPGDHRRLELDLLLNLGVCQTFTVGHTSPAVLRTYARARELAFRCGGIDDRFQALYGLRRNRLLSGDLPAAVELNSELCSLAEEPRNPVLRSRARLSQTESARYTGDFASIVPEYRTVQASFDVDRELGQAAVYGTAESIILGILTQIVLWHRGFPDQALQLGRQTLHQAAEMGHSLNLIHANLYHAQLHQARREPGEAYQLSEQALGLAREQGNKFIETYSGVFSGWALGKLGSYESGCRRMRSYLALARSRGIVGWYSLMLGLLADVYLSFGRLESAGMVLQEALERVGTTGEGYWEAELLRLSGESHRALGDEAGAEALFLRAIETARSQAARSLRLRSTVSLGRLWITQGRPAEARTIVRKVYREFTEGFDTADLRDAATLLGVQHRPGRDAEAHRLDGDYSGNSATSEALS